MTHPAGKPAHPAHQSAGKSHPLRMLFWESTARCNLECVHCRRLDLEACKDELTTDEAKAMFDSAATLGKPVVVFSGGEPLERPDWADLGAYASGLDLPIALATNGTLVTPEIAREASRVGFRRASISIDGATAKSHDAFRGLPGAFEKAIAGTHYLQEAGVPVQFNVTVSTHNSDELEKLYALAKKHNVVGLHLFMLVPVGCGVELSKTHQLPALEYEKVLHWICGKQQIGDLEIRSTCGPHYYRVAAQRGMKIGHSRGCLCGVSVVFVSHKGEVFPCGYLPVDCGNIRNRELAEIWRDSEVFAKLRDYDQLTGKCGYCSFKKVCGGCRARAFGATGDFLAEEPFCNYDSKAD